MTKVLVAAGDSSNGTAKSIEVLELAKPNVQCQNLPSLPIEAPKAVGSLSAHELPLICPNIPNSKSCFKLVSNNWVPETEFFNGDHPAVVSAAQRMEKNRILTVGSQGAFLYGCCGWTTLKARENSEGSCLIQLQGSSVLAIGGQGSQVTTLMDLSAADVQWTPGPPLQKVRYLSVCGRIRIGPNSPEMSYIVVGGDKEKTTEVTSSLDPKIPWKLGPGINGKLLFSVLKLRSKQTKSV